MEDLKKYRKLGLGQFNAALNQWRAWQMLARELYFSSILLYKEANKARRWLLFWLRFSNFFKLETKTKFFDRLVSKGQTFYQANLLLAFSIENLLKAAYLKENQGDDEITKMPTEIDTHNLKELCDRCNIPLADQEIHYLKVLSDFGLWRGRYVIPKNDQIMAEVYSERFPVIEISEHYRKHKKLPDPIVSVLKKISAKLAV